MMRLFGGELTKTGLIKIIASGVLILITIILVFISVRRFIIRLNFLSALSNYASGSPGEVESALNNVLGLAGDFYQAKEFLAKIKLDAGNLVEAERLYKELEKEFPRETVYVGLGAIYLKRADQLKREATRLRKEKKKSASKSLSKMMECIKKAEDYFRKAQNKNPSCSQAHIGLAYCKLLGKGKQGKKLAYRDFRTILGKIKNKQLSSPTREAMIDLYSGLARAAPYWRISKTKLDIAHQYADAVNVYLTESQEIDDAWVSAQANKITLEGHKVYFEPDIEITKKIIRYSKIREELKKMLKRRKEIKNAAINALLTLRWRIKIAKKDPSPFLIESAIDKEHLLAKNYFLTCAYVFARIANLYVSKGSFTSAYTAVNKMQSVFDMFLSASKLSSWDQIPYKIAHKSKKRIKDKIVLFNNMAAVRYFMGLHTTAVHTKKELFKEAERLLRKALAEAETVAEKSFLYEIHRNLALLLLILERPNKAKAEYEKAKKYFSVALKEAIDRERERVRRLEIKKFYENDAQELKKIFGRIRE